MTFVKVGPKLIILFDNQSTVTADPFFDFSGKPLANLDVELGAGRAVNGEQFAQLFSLPRISRFCARPASFRRVVPIFMMPLLMHYLTGRVRWRCFSLKDCRLASATRTMRHPGTVARRSLRSRR
jgi:hypothetical protein